MATFIYEGGPGEMETLEVDPDRFEYYHRHDHWVVDVEERPGDHDLLWIPRERVYEVRGDPGEFAALE